MYTMDDLLLIEQLNQMASTGKGLDAMRSTSNLEQLLQTKPLTTRGSSPVNVYSAGRPDLTSLPDGPSSQLSGYTGRASRGLRSTGQKALGYIDEVASPIQGGLQKVADKIPVGKGGATIARMAGSGAVKNIARAIPVLGAATAALDAGEIVFGNESAGNKVMDGAAMAIGGTIGGVLGMGNPFLAAAGASTGKLVSDGIQYIFGDKKSPEQRRMEEALAALQGRYI